MEQTPDEQPETAASPPLFLVPGGATDEEVAALTAVLTAVASAAAEPATRAPRSEWAAAHRATRASFPSGPGGWRSSGMPR